MSKTVRYLYVATNMELQNVFMISKDHEILQVC